MQKIAQEQEGAAVSLRLGSGLSSTSWALVAGEAQGGFLLAGEKR